MRHILDLIAVFGPVISYSVKDYWESSISELSLLWETVNANTPLNILLILYSPIMSSVIAKFTHLWATKLASEELPTILEVFQGLEDCYHTLLSASFNGTLHWDVLPLSMQMAPEDCINLTRSQVSKSILEDRSSIPLEDKEPSILTLSLHA